MMAAEPISLEKRRPLKFNIILKLKISFSVKKKNSVNMTHPAILITTMFLVKGLLSDTVEEEAGQKKRENQKDLMQIK